MQIFDLQLAHNLIFIGFNPSGIIFLLVTYAIA